MVASEQAGSVDDKLPAAIEALRSALASRYVLDREVGQGGMATVYLAYDRKHGRNVALKVLRTIFADHKVAQRFLREIAVTARLSHPHILPLLDSGEVEGNPYYVMPYIVGQTVGDRLDREQRLPIDDALSIAIEVADALAYAHAQGVVHRDIKPANILLSGRHALVADFGVAKALTSAASEEDQTQTGHAIGTIAYMSPEQAAGERVDSRSDIFSLGAVLYEMLTGEKAFSGANPRAMMASRFLGTPPSAREKRPEISDDLDLVLSRALASAPDDRFASAGEFEEALMTAARGLVGTGTIRVSGASPQIPSLAVLPFENLSGDKDSDYLSDGITEEILTLLSRRRTLRVCARVSAFAFKDKQDDIRSIGSRLGVLNVLLGSVRRAANRLRVTARLVNARDGFQIWSERYDRTLADVFAIEDEIGSAITNALNATLLGEELPTPPAQRTPSIDVYETYLRGRAFWNRRTHDSMRRAIECFEQAIATDPTYAPAHAGLANAFVTLAVYGAEPPVQVMTAARRAAEAALALDPGLADARVVLGLVAASFDWDWSSAESMFRHAIALEPQLPMAHQGLATNCLTPFGAFDDALKELRVAMEIDPISTVLWTTLASVLLYARRYEEAATAGASVLDLDPSFAPAHFFICQAYTQLADFDLACEYGTRAVELSGSSSETLATLGHALALAGKAKQARDIQTELEQRAAQRYVPPTHLAQIPMALGDQDRALTYLESAVDVRASDLVWLGVRPSYDRVRDEPRFLALLGRLGLPNLPSLTAAP